MGEEVVTVLVVLVGIYAEFGGLRAATGVYGLRLAVLLRHEGRGGKFAELQLRLDTEERRGAADERRARGHRHVTGLDTLHDIIFLALVGKFEVLGVEVECGVGVVGHVELHAVADTGLNGGLYLLVEVEICLAAG